MTTEHFLIKKKRAAFYLAVYSQYGKLPRLQSESQVAKAMLQFCVHHSAGPVEYTVARFTAKNKDELPKEAVLLLSSSEMPFVRQLAAIVVEGAARGDSISQSAAPRGQYYGSSDRKIDRMAPHSISLPETNQKRLAGGTRSLLTRRLSRSNVYVAHSWTAIRVPRVGFMQHYTPADFVRRYRSLGFGRN